MGEEKYLKVWTGLTTGSYAGRDDGYPETKTQLASSIDQFSRNYGKDRKERYYKLTEISKEEMEDLINESLNKQLVVAKEQAKVKIESKIADLQLELKKLNK